MPHLVDGLSIRFVHRGSWRAYVWAQGVEKRIAPVAWRRDYRKEGNEGFITAWFQNDAELRDVRESPGAALIAVADARNYDEFPHRVRTFVSVLEGQPMRSVLDRQGRERGVEFRVVGRATADSLRAKSG
jgi:hypothetical protein